MSIAVKEATPEMFPQVHELLRRFNASNPAITREDWQNLFTYRWKAPDDPLGFVLVDGEKIVGYLGTICSRRDIGGRQEKFCNITSWIVLPEYRRSSMSLLQAVLAVPDCTITDFTPVKTVGVILQSLGFKPLETATAHFYPRLRPLPRPGALIRGLRMTATTNKTVLRQKLRGPALRIFEDHADYGCRHLFFSDGTQSCYVLFTKTRGWRFNWSVIHHINNVPFFLENLDLVRLHLFRCQGTLRFLADARFFAGHPLPMARLQPMVRPRLYRSERLRPEQIDNVYSELVLLPI